MSEHVLRLAVPEDFSGDDAYSIIQSIRVRGGGQSELDHYEIKPIESPHEGGAPSAVAEQREFVNRVNGDKFAFVPRPNGMIPHTLAEVIKMKSGVLEVNPNTGEVTQRNLDELRDRFQ